MVDDAEISGVSDTHDPAAGQDCGFAQADLSVILNRWRIVADRKIASSGSPRARSEWEDAMRSDVKI